MADITTARKAFDLFAKGWATGNFEDYLALLADEMIFWFPAGVHRGKFSGVAGRKEMMAKCHDDAASGNRLTFSSPQYVLTDESSVMFEFESSGTMSGKHYQGHNAIALKVKDGKVTGYREYFGDVSAAEVTS